LEAALTSSATPAFGETDLSNCEREQIHLAGSIQPHGALLVLDDDGTRIIQASANASSFLNLPKDFVGRDLSALPGTMAARIRAQLGAPLHRQAVAVRGRIGEPAIEVDALVHRPAQGGLIVELEKTTESVDLRPLLDGAAQTILDAPSLRALADTTATLFKALTGYDRVMVYRFDELGHGEVFSERREDNIEPFLGNRYPASDIPQIARRLYIQNRVRLLMDVDYTPVPLIPRLSPLNGREVDMSMCFLRSMSPIHLQYLRNMGVNATLVVSLVVGGELWGLIACHHYAPKFVPFAIRSLSELLGEIVSTRIAALESFVQSQSELIVRRLEQRMIEAIGRDGDWRVALFDGPGTLLQSTNAKGAALVYEGQIQTSGEVPSTQQIRAVAAWLDDKPRTPLFATTTLGQDAPAFAGMTDVATGLLATRISASPGEYLLWFRPERKHTVTWGGDPNKPVIVGSDPRQLSPRLSFAQWHEVVEGTSDPWTKGDRITAQLISNTISDMVLQFRSVRMLIAQDQLESLSRQVRLSDQPMIVAATNGRILLTNEAFQKLLQAGHGALQFLEDLPALCAEPLDMRRHIDELVRQDRPWRGEIGLAMIGGPPKPLAIRAEPVYASVDRKLGYLLHFDPISDRKAAEIARQHFHESMIDRRLLRASRLDMAGDRDYQAVLTTIVENAQLAALEITYGVDADNMPRMLEAVRASVGRSADLLEHLLWHADGVDSGRRD
jgi:light-regulated signal transduction histidine kinase (bacteriophytochrome)